MQAKINGLKINYIALGKGRPFLILHGWGSKSNRWQKTGEEISLKGFKVFIPDMPGFGESEKPEIPWDLNDYCEFVDEFIKALNIDKFFLLGHSFGGAVSVKYSLKYPQKVEKLYLVASSCIRKKNKKKSFFRFISKILKIFSFFPYYPLFRKAFYKFVIRKSDYIYTEGIMKETFVKIINEDLTPKLPNVKTPVVIIWGEKDCVVPIESAKIINREIKGSKLVIIPEATHDLEKEMPVILAEKILENL